MAIIAVVNPKAGASLDRARFGQLVRRLRGIGREVIVRETTRPGDATEFAAGVSEDSEAVIAVGGDGTVREVAEGLTGRDVPMAIWPEGTENLVAKFFGFRASIDTAMQALLEGEQRAVDVGVINGKSFLVVAGVGFDGEASHRLEKVRNGNITHLSYVVPILRTFCEHRWPHFCVVVDGEVFFEGRGLAFVGNLPQYALGIPVVRDAVGDDGLLDVVVFPCDSKLRLMVHSFWTLMGRNVERGALTRRCRHVTIASDEQVPVEVDGEAWGHLPVDVGILPNAVRMKVPPARGVTGRIGAVREPGTTGRLLDES